MKTADLIAYAVRDTLKSSPRAIGVLLSPVGLSGDNVVASLRRARQLLGAQHYLVGSAPDAPLVSEERFFVASDQRAAERATFWRNRVRSGDGARLVYVSVEEHGKANGLHDCLIALEEDQIAGAFLDWCDDPENRMPEGLAAALRDARVIEGMLLEDLCGFAVAVTKDLVRSKRPWEVVGKHLPLLGLARDSGLGEDDTAERLLNNVRLVRALATGEARRKTGVGVIGDVEDHLTGLLDAGEELRSALAAIDLGEIKTEKIAPKAPKRGPRGAKPTKGKPGKPAAGARGKGGEKGSRKDQTNGEATARPHGRSPVSEPPSGGGASTAATNGSAPSVGSSGPKPAPPGPAPVPPPRSLRVSAPPLSQGLDALLTALLNGDGDPVGVKVRGDTRHVLAVSPKNVEPRAMELGASRERLSEPLAAWRKRRARFVESARSLTAPSSSLPSALVGALPKLLSDKACRTAFEAFAEATRALYRAALDQSEQVMREVLALDTVVVLDGSGVAVRVVGPLHLLGFGQVLERMRIEEEATKIPESSRRVLLRAGSVGPTAPAEFPEVGGGELSLSRHEDGLIVFERTPELVERASLESFGQSLLRRYLSLSPHAILGCRIVFEGEGAENFLDGVAQYLISDGEGATVEVLCARPPTLRDKSPALPLLSEGRLRLGALPLDPKEITRTRPHIIVKVPSGRPHPHEEEPSVTAAQVLAPAVGPSRTRFELRERSLRIVTSVAGIASLESFEALHAAALGRRSRGAFVLDASGLSLRGEVDINRGVASTWHAVIAPSLGDRPPLGAYLLVHERIDDRSVSAVLSREVRAAMRSVREGLARAGMSEEKPTALRAIATRLAQTCGGGLLSLRKDNVELLTSALLTMDLVRRLEGRGVVVPLSGRGYEALTGESSADVSMQVALGATNNVLRAIIGFATFDPNIDLDLSLPQVGGRVGERLSAVVNTIQMLRGDDIGAQAARDAVGWLVWPALAGMDASERSNDLVGALSDWSRVKELRIEVSLMTPAQMQLPKGKAPKVSRWSVTVTTIDVPLIKRLLLSA